MVVQRLLQEFAQPQNNPGLADGRHEPHVDEAVRDALAARVAGDTGRLVEERVEPGPATQDALKAGEKVSKIVL